jgi:hypothetical protein
VENPDRVITLVVFKTIVFGEDAFVSGRFRRLESTEAEATPYVGRQITLEAAPPPFTGFTPFASTVTDREGYFAFTAPKPPINTRYRAVATGDPPLYSEAKLIRVRIGTEVEVSRKRVARGDEVLVSGTAQPAHDGAQVEIQAKPAEGKGRFRTVARARLRDDGDEQSTFRRRVEVEEDTLFRVRVAGDADNLPSAPGRGVRVDVR